MSTPNVLYIMSDQHSPKASGCYGHPMIQTPHIDGLAAHGTRFAWAYTPSPICVPARACLATGRYVHETDCWDNVHPYTGQVPSWAHRLREAGHTVTSIGKLHYRNEIDDTGFTEQIVPMHLAKGEGDLKGLLRDPLPGRRKNSKFATKIGPGESSYTEFDRKVVAEAETWLSNVAKAQPKPWVLSVSFVCPHHPLIAPPEFYELYEPDLVPAPKTIPRRHPWIEALQENRNHDDFFTDETRRIAIASYFGLCSFLDDNIGKVLSSLEANGFGENTIVIYTSDHGENLGSRGLWGKNNFYEESGGIPMMVAGPGIPAGAISQTPVSLMDIYPTVLQAIGLDPVSPGVTPQGRSIVTIANAPDETDRMIFSEYHAAASPSAGFMIRKGDYKYIHYVGYEPELFDLRNDPEELNNLAADPGYAELVRTYETHLRGVCDPDAVNERAFAAQNKMINDHGGYDVLAGRGFMQGTPPPGYEPELLT